VRRAPYYTVSVNVLRLLAAFLRARGVDVSELLSREGIAPGLLEDLDGRIPLRTACELLEDAALLVDEPNIGLAIGSGPPFGEGVLPYKMWASPTLGDALGLATRYFRLVGDLPVPHMIQTGGRVRLSYYAPLDDPHPLRHLVDLYQARAMFLGRKFTGVDWIPLAVRFRHARPKRIEEYRRLFRAPLVFDHPVDELELRPEILKLEVKSRDPRLFRHLARCAAEALSRLPPLDNFAVAVRMAVAASLRQRNPTLEQVASHFHISTRTLQRRLEGANLTLRQLVDDVRRELAMRYLESDQLSLAEVGFLLGFDGRQSFHRAFRRWTGTTPASARRRLRWDATQVKS
jgi:AraC-like DNA-binding protein